MRSPVAPLGAGLAAVGALAVLFPSLPAAQSATRKATTVSALLTYPVFYHGQRVVARGEVVEADGVPSLRAGELELLCLGCEPTAAGTRVDVVGTFWDVGRLEPGDPRVPAGEVQRVAERLLRKPWPGIGELPVLTADEAAPADLAPAASVRALALEPAQYEGRTVTLAGRFRGRNLYGDLPESPRQSRWDFVLHSGDAAVWVTGIRPRGRDFELHVDARVDTRHWIEVSGVVRHGRGLVWLEADRIALAEEPEEPAPAPVPVRVQGPPPEVIFSVPTGGEVDVRPDTNVRIQFSRDVDPDSFAGRVRAGYLGAESAGGESETPPLELTAVYQPGNRVLEITFAQPLEPFRTLRVELLPGIAARDESAMEEPWVLMFTIGG